MMFIRRLFLNFIGNLRGFSSCFKCGDTWNWKECGEISFSGGGIFPLCKDCQSKCSDEELRTWSEMLFEEWKKDSSDYDKTIKHIEHIKSTGQLWKDI